MNDRSVVLMVVGFLGVIAVFSLGAIVTLLLHDKDVPDAAMLLFSNVAVGALGGITGLLANTHTSPPNPPALPAPEA